MNAAAEPGFMKSMEEMGYFGVREDPDGNVHGLCRFIFTVAIVCNLDDAGYSHRYCYDSLLAARTALNMWELSGFQGEPTGYIKRK